MAEKKSKILNTTVSFNQLVAILNTTSVCIYMLFGFAFAEAPQPGTTETLLASELYPDVEPGTTETLLASELYPDVEPGTIDTTGSFNQLVAINVKKTLEKTYISEEQILKYIQEAPLPSNFELSINHSVVIKVNHTKFEIERSSFGIEASELKKQIATLEKKCSDSEAESVKYAVQLAEFASELEEFRTNASTLEISLQAAIEKEKELTQSLNVATEEKKKLEEALKSSGEKLSEAETLVEVLLIELSSTQENLKSVENDLLAAGLRESEIMEILKATRATTQGESSSSSAPNFGTMMDELRTMHLAIMEMFERIDKRFDKMEERQTTLETRFQNLNKDA